MGCDILLVSSLHMYHVVSKDHSFLPVERIQQPLLT